MSLTDTAIKALRPKEKSYRMFDGGGLYLEVMSTGSRIWRVKYRFEGKEKRLTIGAYPLVTLKDARAALVVAKGSLARGDDPSCKKVIKREQIKTFRVIAEEWTNKKSEIWSDGHTKTVAYRLRKFVFQNIGDKSVDEISPPDVLRLLQLIEASGHHETASRVLGICSQVFRYAVACGLCQSDPCRDLKGALSPHKETPRSALTTPEEAGALMASIAGYQGYSVVRAALYWSAYTFCRPGEVRRAEWSEIAWEKKEWRIPAEKMKMGKEHCVPLCRQCMQILHKLKDNLYSERWIFPSTRVSRPLSENGVLSALRRMGYEKSEMCAHGFRAMASTLLNEQGYRPDLIERQLAHCDANKIRAVYNRATYMEERRAMMQQWADYLDSLALGKRSHLVRQESSE